jgi:hypothetical protein
MCAKNASTKLITIESAPTATTDRRVLEARQFNARSIL